MAEMWMSVRCSVGGQESCCSPPPALKDDFQDAFFEVDFLVGQSCAPASTAISTHETSRLHQLCTARPCGSRKPSRRRRPASTRLALVD
jgi:hypothetical protein